MTDILKEVYETNSCSAYEVYKEAVKKLIPSYYKMQKII